MSSLGAASEQFPLPKNRNLPVFVYGLLKRGELGHGQVKDFLLDERSVEEVQVPGLELIILDGLAYAIRAEPVKSVFGQLLQVTPEAYEAIILFENYGSSSPKYKWAEISGPFGSANTLISTAKKFQSRHERSDNWSILNDKFFVEGIPWVRSQLEGLRFVSESASEKLFEALAAFWVTAITFERTVKFWFGIPPLGEAYSLRRTIQGNINNDASWKEAFEAFCNSKELRNDERDIREFLQNWVDLRNKLKNKRDPSYTWEIVSQTETMLDFLELFLGLQSDQLVKEWRRQGRFPGEEHGALTAMELEPGFDFTSHGLEWCRCNISEFRNRLDKSVGYAEGSGGVYLQATFLVAWSLFEAVLESHYPNYVDAKSAVSERLKGDPKWAEAIQLKEPLRFGWIWSQFNPVVERPSDPFCFDAWKELRNNVIHRGKSAIPEFRLVLEAAESMVGIVESYLGLLDPAEESSKGK